MSGKRVPRRKRTAAQKTEELRYRDHRRVYAIVVLVGLPLFIWMGVLPLVRYFQLESWETRPCTIEKARMVIEKSADSSVDQYYLELEYTYDWDGVRYVGTRYDVGETRSWNHATLSEILRELPVGLKTECRVDPNDPSVAVLSDRFPYGISWSLIPLLMVLAGVGGLIAGSRENASDSFESTRQSPADADDSR